MMIMMQGAKEEYELVRVALVLEKAYLALPIVVVAANTSGGPHCG